MMNSSSTKTVRVAFLGSGNVGKTSIIHRIVDKTFVTAYAPTLYDVYTKSVSVNKMSFSLELIDTAGYHSFPAMLDLVIGCADIFVFVYSVYDESSIKYLCQLKKRVVETRGFFPMETPMVVIANKVDLSNSATCTTKRLRAESLEDFANWGTSFLATSCKLNFGISSLLHFLTDEGGCCVRLKEMSLANKTPSARDDLDDNVFEENPQTSETKKRRVSKSVKMAAARLVRASTGPIRRMSRKLSRHSSQQRKWRFSSLLQV